MVVKSKAKKERKRKKERKKERGYIPSRDPLYVVYNKQAGRSMMDLLPVFGYIAV
jgi:hypothetical protein